ncbi:MAG: hypothetical protein QXT75_07255 [Desulfurococcaceae archaeon]
MLFAYVLATRGYSDTYPVLIIPGLLVMLFIAIAWYLYPRIRSVNTAGGIISISGIGKECWLYVASMIFQSLGFIHSAITSYFLKYWGFQEMLK